MTFYRLLIHALTLPGRLYCALRHPRDVKRRGLGYGIHQGRAWCTACGAFRALALAAVLLAGCETSVRGTPCYGLFDQAKKHSEVEYEISTVNVVGAVVFSETIVVPALIIGLVLWCPIDQPARATPDGGTP